MNENRHLPAFTLLLLIASGLLVTCFPEVSGMVGTEPTAIGWQDRQIRLPCIFGVTPQAVYWAKNNMSHPGELETVATFFNQEFTSKKKRFDMEEDFSLVITNLEVLDEGHYQCQVVLPNFDDFANSTLLTVNAIAKEHIIEQCVGEVHSSNPCTIQTSREAPTFHLDCRVTGFKPNVSLVWSKSGRALPPVWSDQNTFPDGTFERLETISVTTTHDTDQNFICTASGVSIEGGSSKAYITVLPLNEPEVIRGPNKIGLGIGLTALFLVVITVLFLAAGKFLQTYKPELLPDVEERDKLRCQIREYRPGSASEYNLGDLQRVNINLFGEMSAGKSAFINSIFFAFKGIFDNVAAEGSAESGGGQTKMRNHYPLTDFITLQDNRGMPNFDLQELERIKDEMHGCRSIDTTRKIQKDKSQECHAAVLVYYRTQIGEQDAHTFIYRFFQEVKSIHAASPLLVITHGDEYQDTKAVVRNVEPYVGDGKRILLLENYTEEKHEENIAKDIRMLQFLWTILKTCDQNAYNLAIKNLEIVVEEPKKPRPKTQNPAPEPPKENKGSLCNVM